jgi:hypothetical protein
MHMTPNPIDPRLKREAAKKAAQIARMKKLNNTFAIIGLLLLALLLLR